MRVNKGKINILFEKFTLYFIEFFKLMNLTELLLVNMSLKFSTYQEDTPGYLSKYYFSNSIIIYGSFDSHLSMKQVYECG